MSLLAVLDHARADGVPTSLPALSPLLCHGKWSIPPEPGLAPGASLERSPGHPSIPAGCRFPWKLMRSRILLRGLPEEILEGPSYNAALPVPEGPPSTEKALRADGTGRPRGDAVLPHGTSLSSPPGARFPPGCRPAAPLRIKNTERQ